MRRNDIKRLTQLIKDNAAAEPGGIKIPVQNGCEIGICTGSTSAGLLSAFPELQLLMVDRWTAYPAGHRDYGGRMDQSKMTIHMINAIDVTMFAQDRRVMMVGDSANCVHLIKDQSLDFIFIDASHDEDSVFEDLTNYAPKVKPGGLWSGHDYGNLHDRSGRFGVKKAIGRAHV